MKLNDQRLYLNTYDHRTFCFKYNPKIRIPQLKDQIYKKSKINPENMVLLYDGKKLNENILLSENLVPGGSSIYLQVESM